jgi:hypothetical protein
MLISKRFVALASISLLALTAQAQFHGSPGFFGGYADGLTSLPTGRNTLGPQLRMVYDDFSFFVPGSITGFEIIGRDNTGSPVGMYYEIRSGVSEGNGGTLLFSGFTPSAAAGDLPLSGSFGTPPPGTGNYRWYDAGPSTPIQLEPGTYWIGLAPHQGFGSFDVASTQGLLGEGLPVNNGNAFYYDSSDSAKNFVSQGANDFGLRVVTTAAVVPEPRTAGLLLLGAAAGLLVLRISRRRAASRTVS